MNTDTMNEKQKEVWDLFLWRACDYARHYGRWPEAEKYIIKDPERAYKYAEYVIEGRWPEAEETIIKSPKWAYCYAKDVIKGRWPEAEGTIIESALGAYRYAQDVIEGRWPEAEETIIKSPKYAYLYAIDAIKGRWPEAEKTISEAGFYADEYIKAFDFYRRSAILESNYLCDTGRCEFRRVKEYVSKIDWSDPANDFPIPKRLKDALKKACVTK